MRAIVALVLVASVACTAATAPRAGGPTTTLSTTPTADPPPPSPPPSPSPTLVEVPDVTTTLSANFSSPGVDELDLGIAESLAEEAGLVLGKVKHKVTIEWPPDVVISQRPWAGKMVEPLTKVTVTVVMAPKCDPAYRAFCIPPWLPDLDCIDVRPHTGFRVLQPRDPYGFDADGDGVGCET